MWTDFPSFHWDAVAKGVFINATCHVLTCVVGELVVNGCINIRRQRVEEAIEGETIRHLLHTSHIQ